MVEELKLTARNFLQLIIEGKIDEAFEKTTQDFIHHNANTPGGREALMKGMKDNHQMFPEKKFTIKQIIAEGNKVSTYSEIELGPKAPHVAVMHIFRFENNLIAELWDLGMPIPENCPNPNGLF